jgi:hypothetical protein
MLSNINTDDLHYCYLEQGENFAQSFIWSIADSTAYFKKNLKKYL